MNYVEEASGNGLAEATTILFPPTQVMGSSGRRPHAGYDRNRIPSSVFSNKPTTPLEWSIASSESLFSIIAAGNNSFSVADQLKQHSDIIATNFSGSGSGSAEPAPHEAAATVAPSAGSIKNGVEVRLHSFIALRHDDRQHADQIPASSSKTAFDSKDNGGAPKTKGNESPAPANYMINIAVDHQNTMTGISCSSGDAGSPGESHGSEAAGVLASEADLKKTEDDDDDDDDESQQVPPAVQAAPTATYNSCSWLSCFSCCFGSR